MRLIQTLIIAAELIISKNFLNEAFPDNLVIHGDAEIATENLVAALVETAEKEFLQKIRPAGSATTYPWNITVIENPVVNAYCAPGGSVVVFSGLIDFCVEAERQKKIDNAAAAVCGVVAHEVSHGVLRHGMETLSWLPILLLIMLFAQVLFVSFGFGPEEVRLLNTVFQEIIQFFLRLPHSRAVESEADLLGAELLLKTGLPTSDYPKILSLLQSGNSEWFSTHPAPERRSLAIQKHLQAKAEDATPRETFSDENVHGAIRLIQDSHARFLRFYRRPNKASQPRIGGMGQGFVETNRKV